MKWKGSIHKSHWSFCSSRFLENIIARLGKCHERRPRATLQQKMFLFNFHKLV
jgi:hypothetical protein